MTDITDRIAAWPPMPGKNDWHETAATGHKLRSERLQAERDLALEVLRAVMDYAEHGDITGRGRPFSEIKADARAVLAACEKERA